MTTSKHVKEKKPDDIQNMIIDELMLDLIDEVSCGLCFEVHRASKLGTLFLDETDIESAQQFEIVNEQGLDVFGQLPSKKQYECICPSCQRSLAASRFAPHLEKCMGMGRISSRIASRRIANNTGRRGSDMDSDGDDNSNDASYAPDRKAKKLKRDKHTNSSKRTKSSKVKAVDSPTVSFSTETVSTPTLQSLIETSTLDEKKNLMANTCGVISEHTRKMCTRSLKCPQHTDKQRRAVREFLFGQQSGTSATIDDPIDVDSLDELSAGQMMASWDSSSNPSPSSSHLAVNSATGIRKQKSMSQLSRKRPATTQFSLSDHSDSYSGTL